MIIGLSWLIIGFRLKIIWWNSNVDFCPCHILGLSFFILLERGPNLNLVLQHGHEISLTDKSNV